MAQNQAMSLNQDLMKAVQNNDSECVLRLIEQGADVNSPDFFGQTPLHNAVVYNRTDIVELLINQGNIEINSRNATGVTPLMLSIRCDNLVATNSLLAKGCDVNITDNTGESPLHVAVAKSMTDVGEMLLNNHADVNVENARGHTPFSLAIVYQNVEFIYILLAYGVDIFRKDINGKTAFNYALLTMTHKLADILIDHCDFNYDDVNIFISSELGFKYLLKERNIELFKFVWPRFNRRLLREGYNNFINFYLAERSYSNANWIECLYLMLGPEILVLSCDLVASHDCTRQRCDFIQRLFAAFQWRCIELNDRLSIIYTLLSLGFEVCYHDFQQVLKLYGFNDELEVFLNTGSINTLGEITMATFIVAGENDYSSLTITKLFDNQLNVPRLNESNHVLDIAKFFVVSSDVKMRMLEFCCRKFNCNRNDLADKLSKLPNSPSLLELSRNQVRLHIKSKYNVRKSYQFHDAVMKLPIPDKIKDIIRFKAPIYEF